MDSRSINEGRCASLAASRVLSPASSLSTSQHLAWQTRSGTPCAPPDEEALCAAAGGELALSGCPLAAAKLLVLLVEASGRVIYCRLQPVLLETPAENLAGREPGAGGEGHEKSRQQWDVSLLAPGHSRMRAKTGTPRREPGKAARPTPDVTGDPPSGTRPL